MAIVHHAWHMYESFEGLLKKITRAFLLLLLLLFKKNYKKAFLIIKIVKRCLFFLKS